MGYFKMNLFPIAFRNTSPQHWCEAFSGITGLGGREDYLKWCCENRLPNLKTWRETYFPEVIVCIGKTYLRYFAASFLDMERDVEHEVIEDRELSWAINSQGTLVVILPFMLNRYGLVKNNTIQKFGGRIAELRHLAMGRR